MKHPPKPTKSAETLRLRPTINGKTYVLHIGSWSNQSDHDKANRIAQLMYDDYQAGLFDCSLEKYKQLVKTPRPKVITKETIITDLVADIASNPTVHTIRENVLAHLRRYPKPINSPVQAQAFVNHLASQLAPSTVSQYLARLKHICQPLFSSIKPPSQAYQLPEVHSQTDLEAIFKALENFEYLPYLILLSQLGTRPSELLALHWSDVNLSERFVIIRFSLNTKGEIKATKTNKVRRVSLTLKALETLTKLRNTNLNQTGLVFQNSEGIPLKLATIRAAYYRTLEASGIPKSRLYKFRGTVATRLLEKGFTPTAVAQTLGNSPVTLMNRYIGITNQITIDSLD
ncbi:tyrosine-type recombinase/integrase [Pannus brasiliensis CCIBt3594]|uniref:Tyrosine-type recombinase/integrase n=1 Tax=Pannus brasiliensis CCIBt3594 TaxID=1427578 RepID=A0AAW9QR28_9CHRO